MATGWHHSLIPDEYLIAGFFQSEVDEVDALEAAISTAQGELAEAVETAREVAAFEPEEDEKATATVIKKALHALIKDLRGSSGESAQKELAALQEQDQAIKMLEQRIRETRATLKVRGDELKLKQQLKRLGEFTEVDAKRLILKKLHDIADVELNRHLNAEKRALIAVVENLWDKYAVSSRELEQARKQTLKALDGFLEGLGYLGDRQ